ncbi:hypothetical protein BGI08_06330 [Snodgrassella alvi]|nr:hypothetical protein BGI08_06330 [Snodgrassella alvi]
MSLPPLPYKLSLPSPPFRTSSTFLPSTPIRMSLPAPPFRIFLPSAQPLIVLSVSSPSAVKVKLFLIY